MKDKLFALIDCNNFFVSCERVFRPDLRTHPTVVLSNNDGCIIARSAEIKAMGIPMGAPLFQYRKALEHVNTAIFSANFHLYGDFSQRIVSILTQHCSDIEVYSVDESFINLDFLLKTDSTPPNAQEASRIEAAALVWGRQVKHDIYRATGIPVSVGIGPTKTLAKLAAEICKTPGSATNGTYVMPLHADKRTSILSTLKIDAVWGIGPRTAPKLTSLDINTVADFITQPDPWVLKTMTITGLRTLKELRGESCLPLETEEPAQKQIVRSRSFGNPINTIETLETAVSNFAVQAAAKARADNLHPHTVHTFLITHAPHGQQQYRTLATTLERPTNNTGDIITAALAALRGLFHPGGVYRKAGVMLDRMDANNGQTEQLDLFENPGHTDFTSEDESRRKQANLMAIVDKVNSRYAVNRTTHKSLIRHGTQVQTKPQLWESTRSRKSPAYTFDWKDIYPITVW